MKLLTDWKIWKEEYDAIATQELKEIKKGKHSKATARRMLIWTEGFMLKALTIDINEMTEEDKKILSELRIKNLEMLGKFKHPK